MQEKKREDIYYEDEIDLYELWLKLVKRKGLIFMITLLSVALSAVYLFMQKPIYKSTFVIRTNIFSPQETVKYLEVIKKNLGNGQTSKVAGIMGLSEEEVLQIRTIEARTIRGVKNVVEVSVETLEPTLVKKVSQRIVDYLNERTYTAFRLELERQKLLSNLKELESRVRSLEEIKKLVESTLKKGGEIAFNPGELDRMITDINSRIIDIKNRLALLRGFELSVEPDIPTKPSKPKKALILSVSLVSGFFLGIFIALFMEWLSEAKKRHSQ